MRRTRWAFALAVPVAALGAVGVVQASSAKAVKLTGSVGPGFTISMSKKALTAPKGAGSVTVDLTVDDRSASHNFHLLGVKGSVSGSARKQAVQTDVAATGKTTFTGIVLKKGKTYTAVCDPHGFSTTITVK